MGQVNLPKVRFEKFPTWVIRSGVFFQLSSTAKDVYVALLWFERRQEGGRIFAFCSAQKLGETIGSKSHAAARGVRELIAAGLIVRLNTPRKGVAGEYEIQRRRPASPVVQEVLPAPIVRPKPVPVHVQNGPFFE